MKHAVILSSARTGSTFLGELLKQHSRVHYGAELLDGVTDLATAKAKVEASKERGKERGRDCHIWKLQNHQAQAVPGLMAWLSQQEGLTAITLCRRNLLEQYVSGVVAHKRGKYTLRVGDELEPVPPFHICQGELQSFMDGEIAWQQQVQETFSACDGFLSLTYEELAANYQRVCSKIFRVLALKPIPVTPTMLRMRGDHVRRQVLNWDGLVSTFAHTRYGEYGFRR